MMSSVSGKRGIGKTYFLSKEIYRRYLSGFFIITNFSHVYSHVDCSYLTPEEFINFLTELLLFKDYGYDMCDIFPAFKHGGVFIAIDEGHLYFSADKFKEYQQKDEFQDILKLLAQARKQDIEIWYTVQDPSKIDKNWRRYTEDWIRYRPVLNFSYKKLVLNKEKGTFRREVRYPLPFVWEEYHNLDVSNPVFNYATIRDENGVSHFSPQSTIISRKIKTSGWLDPFPYRLYDSNQVLAIRKNNQNPDFGNLTKSFGYVPHSFKKEKFPTFKKILNIEPNDARLPPKYYFNNIVLPDPEGIEKRKNILSQPSFILDSINSILDNSAKEGRKGLLPRDLLTQSQGEGNG